MATRKRDERAPHARTIALSFAARQCFGLMRKAEKSGFGRTQSGSAFVQPAKTPRLLVTSEW